MVALGIGFVVVALVLALAEAHLSSGGLIGALAGVATIGAAVLLLLAAGAGAAVVLVIALCMAVGAASLLVLGRRRIGLALHGRPRTGREALVGHVGVVRGGGGGELQVFVNGSLWRAAPDPLCAERFRLFGRAESSGAVLLLLRRSCRNFSQARTCTAEPVKQQVVLRSRHDVVSSEALFQMQQ